jgi:hypothetical protein
MKTLICAAVLMLPCAASAQDLWFTYGELVTESGEIPAGLQMYFAGYHHGFVAAAYLEGDCNPNRIMRTKPRDLIDALAKRDRPADEPVDPQVLMLVAYSLCGP